MTRVGPSLPISCGALLLRCGFGAAQGSAVLRVADTAPEGAFDTLAQANEIRIVFAQPMVGPATPGVPMRAVSPGGGAVEWREPGRLIGSAPAGRGLEWPLTPGTHRIEGRDARGRAAEATVVVR